MMSEESAKRTKREYVKPAMVVIAVDPQRMICASIDGAADYTEDLGTEPPPFWYDETE